MSMVLFHVLESQLGQRLTRCVCRRESASPRVFSWLPPQLFLAPAKRTLLMKRVAAGYHTCHARTIWKEKAPYSQNFEVSRRHSRTPLSTPKVDCHQQHLVYYRVLYLLFGFPRDTSVTRCPLQPVALIGLDSEDHFIWCGKQPSGGRLASRDLPTLNGDFTPDTLPASPH
jgi:hypothetical protein